MQTQATLHSKTDISSQMASEACPFCSKKKIWFEIISEISEPVLYKRGQFGARLENVLEVTDPEKQHTSGLRFLKFQDVSLVPYEPKLIDKSLLSANEVRIYRTESSLRLLSNLSHFDSIYRNDGSTNTMHEFERWSALSSRRNLTCKHSTGWWIRRSTWLNIYRNPNWDSATHVPYQKPSIYSFLWCW